MAATCQDTVCVSVCRCLMQHSVAPLSPSRWDTCCVAGGDATMHVVGVFLL